MIKRLLSSLLTLIMLLSATGAAAITTVYETGYTSGETHHIVDVADIISTDNASVESDGVLINAVGSATFGFYLPYSSRSLTLKYSGSGDITVDTGDNIYNATLPDAGEYLLEFGANLGKEPQAYRYNNRPDATSGFYRDYVEHRGEKEVKITALSGNITITQLMFEKEKTPYPRTASLTPSVSATVLDTVNTVFIDTNAPIIVANGGRRYIDPNNIDMLPFNYNGSIYLPINTLAKALGYYHEEISEKGYALMRSESHEVVLLGDVCTVSKGVGERKPTPDNVFIYREGKIMAAVRYFAELLGKTVGFKNGLVIIDDKYTVKDILSQDSYLNYAISKFAPFKENVASGKTYYVAQTELASDNNSGTVFAPFKTLAKAAKEAKAGDTVIIREGVYRETLAPSNSGTASAPITFRAAEGENVVISANDKLGTLAQYENNVYITAMPTDLGDGRNQIFINNEMQTEARYPNGPLVSVEEGKLSNAWPVRGNLYRPINTSAADEMYDKVHSDTLLDQEEDDYWAGGTYVGLMSYAYAVTSAKIKSSTKGELTLDETNRTDRTHWWLQDPARIPGKSNYGYIVGHEHAMDLPGEWIRTEDGNLKIILPEGTDATKLQVEAKARQLVIDLTNKNFINIEGIKTIGGSARMYNGEMCMLKDMDMKYITHYTVSADSRDGYITFPFSRTKEGAPQKGEVGIYISGTDHMLIDSTIDHSAGAAVYLVGSYTYIENNIMNDCGYMGSYVAGIHADTQAWDSGTKARGGYAIYNNTVYNVGRACLNISSIEHSGHSQAPYLPMDIAYNSFSDAMLMAEDVGTTYSYGVNLGVDRRRTELHHNYVYTNSIEKEASHHSVGIYWDGLSHGSDTYQNVVFYTGANAPFAGAAVSQQTISTGVAWHRIWENHAIGYAAEGAENLQAAYFSEERPFYAGATLNNEAYTLNYERFKNGLYGMRYTAKDAVLSEGAEISDEDGYASFTGDGQWIEFQNVDFGDGANEIAIVAYGDSNNTYDEIEVIIDNDEASSHKTIVDISSPDLNDVHTERIAVAAKTGIHNVKIRVNKYVSAKIGGISVYNHKAEFMNENFAHFMYAGAYNARNNLQTHEENTNFAQWQYDTYSYNYAVAAVKSTFPDNYLRYDDQIITDDVTHLVVSAGSRGEYRKGKLTVYLDSLDSEPVAEYIFLNKQFYDYTPALVELNKKVNAGTYDIYLVFTDDTPALAGGLGEGVSKHWTNTSASSNFLYFGFLKEGADLSAYKVRVREYGGYFDETLSTQNEEQPFHKLYLNSAPYYYNNQAILYTYPGTKAVYTDVDIPAGCTQMYLAYAADAEHAGQPVEVRLKESNNENATEIITSFVSQEHSFTDELISIPLSDEIPAGNYTVTLSFGGDVNTKKTLQLSWFGFGVAE